MMKHLYILLITCLIVSNISAQSTSKIDIALQHIKTNADKLKLDNQDYENLIVSQEVTSEKGITYMYLIQTVDNIPVRNAIMTVIIDAKGKVVSDANSFVPNANKLAKKSGSKITADKAIISAADHLGIKPTTKPILVAGKNVNSAITYAFPELAKTAIPAKLSYDLIGTELVLTWNLNINMRNSADYWDINIDANSGQFVSKNNFTVYCKHHKDDYARHDDCQINTFNKTHDANWRVSTAIANRAAASYKVFKLPAESPNHNATRQLATDDEFPLASPFGWHDTNGVNGAEYTITRGNNAYAYQDKDDDDESDGQDTDGGSTLNFDFAYDNTLDPRDSDDAALTNLFYMVNMMHDITATAGFTEEFGNFQDKNYSGKAVDGEDDYVLAQAFDGITLYESNQDLDADGNHTKIDNANFSTPNDGFNGRMQMFLWRNSGGAISIDEPTQLAGFVDQYGIASFGKPIPLATEPALKGIVALARDNSPTPTLGCGTISNGPEIAGKIAMVERGICEFGRKALNVQQAGAIACIICNVPGINGGNGEETIGLAAGAVGSQVTIPTIMMKKSDCDRIRLSMSNDVPVAMTWQVRDRVGSAFLDGALDNGVIAHEFGHGVSTRLTGGRLNSSCLNNDEQMGEGWSDFFALVTSHEPGDKGTDSRGIGTFAKGQKINGGGIRRYPYSTDMKINPETFDYIKGTAAPHPLGEVWASMTWDLYWALIDKYGYDPDLSNKNSGNYKGIFLVMEGMKMQPCNPGFISGRDAILKADQVHYNGENNCLISSVFARRGLGVNASGGLTTDRNDGTQNFEPLATCIENLKIQKTITPSVDAGGEVEVTITAYNHIRTPITNIKITDELDAGMSYVANSGTIQPTINGNVLTFNVGTMDYDKPYVIKFKALTNPNNKTIAYVNENFDGDINWEIDKIEGVEDFLPSYDVFRSPEVSMRVINVAADVDAILISQPYPVTGNNPGVKFWHRYDTEASADGGFLEISVNGGAFQLVKNDKFVRNGYNNPIAYATLAIPSLEGFSGTTSNQWVESVVDLSEYKNKTLVFRYRFVSDANTASTADFKGWMIDDFSLVDFYIYTTKACIFADNVTPVCTPELKTLVNNSNTGVSTKDVDNYFEVVISPNPVEDILYIDASAKSSTPAQIEIISADGQLVQKSNFAIHHDGSKIALPVGDLATGVYIIKIQSGTHLHTTKIVKK